MASLTILTMSFARDLELCRLLCETVDEFVPPGIEHVLAVPKSDVPAFAALKNARRSVVAEDAFTPRWVRKMPSMPDWVRNRVRFARRNLYLSLKGPPIRGWIVQQLMKLQATEQIGSDVIMHVDSDVAFVRPFDMARVWRDGKAALLRFPGDGDTPTQHPWHHAASAALGLGDRAYFGAGYISNCVVWRRSTAEALLTRIASTTGRDPIAYLSRVTNFSEYILYGVFCEFVLGLDAAGHFQTDRQLCRTLWARGGQDEAAELFATLDDEVAIGIQSTIPIPIETRAALVRRLRP